MLSVYIVEDDTVACEKLYAFADNNQNIDIIGHTNNSNTALESIKLYNPDAVILDIELTSGSGNGLELLNKINMLSANKRPYVVVTTHTTNPLLYDALRRNGSGLIIYKHQIGYSELEVINHLILMTDSILQAKLSSHESNPNDSLNDLEAIIKQDIFYELTKIGIKTNVSGFKYLSSAIYYTIFNPLDSMLDELNHIYNISKSRIEHSMRNAINYCWRNTAISVLEDNYNGFIHSQSGCPTTTQFITYYAGKLKNKHIRLINESSF